MKLTKSQREAIALYRDFRDGEPKSLKSISVDIPSAVMVMGPVEFVGYTTTQGGRTIRYTHHFAHGSRPLLCAGTEDGQLYLLQGRFRVTDRGIVDLDSRGNEIDD